MPDDPADQPVNEHPAAEAPVPQTPEEALADARAGFDEISSILEQALADDDLAAEAAETARRRADER
ncbi:MAG TPA: hypothetical protein VFG33_13330 [Kribbella sp.]|uniref:hypothetical protein n=1 Tax=Kribbella sp. TaxID=1871183 RepID=UPI002D7A3C84|nr:hypothetical protein [Kribbella sp.]HET6294359.1 hypothetical protein [Kribbella sp.]